MNLREWALPVYTILMQMAVGALFVLWTLRYLLRSKFRREDIDQIVRNPILVIVFTAVVAMIASHFHLSRPLHSFLAVLNFKSSWLSREIAFSVLFFWMMIGLLYLTYFDKKHQNLVTPLGWTAIIVGVILVYCMARIYLLPTQVAWNSTSVIISFYATTLMLGAAALACLMILDLKFAEIQKFADVETRAPLVKYSITGSTLLVVLLACISIAILYVQMYLLDQGGLIAHTSLQLLTELYLPLLVMRQVLLAAASILLSLAIFRMNRLKLPPQNIMVAVYLSCLLIIVGEIVGRFLFYATHIRVGL